MPSSIGSNQLVFCPPLPGKPNPLESWDPAAGDTRSRVVQLPQKGDTCFYYAYNTIRQRIGKNPAPSQLNARQIEAGISAYRKRHTHIATTLGWQQNFAEQLVDNLALSGTKAAMRRQLGNPDFPRLGAPEDKAKCRAALEAFCAQSVYDDFTSYTTSILLKAESENNQKLYDALGVPRDLVVQMTREFKQYQAPDQVLATLAKYFIEVAYKLQKSTWHPTHPITGLMEQLRQYGPHVVNGTFGQQYYENAPFKLAEKVEGRSVFGWQRNAARKEWSGYWHAVTVIGARSDKGLIYFIDPLDGSDPANSDTQKIYVMSYEKFKSSIADLCNVQMKTESGEAAFTEPKEGANQYALHAPAPSLASRMSDLTLESKTKAPKD